MIDIDRAIGDLAEGKVDYWATFVFIHNDAGISYAATVSSLSEGGVIALIYGEEALKTADSIQFPCEKIAVKAVHNPVPLKKKIDEVLPWAVSNL